MTKSSIVFPNEIAQTWKIVWCDEHNFDQNTKIKCQLLSSWAVARNCSGELFYEWGTNSQATTTFNYKQPLYTHENTVTCSHRKCCFNQIYSAHIHWSLSNSTSIVWFTACCRLEMQLYNVAMIRHHCVKVILSNMYWCLSIKNMMHAIWIWSRKKRLASNYLQLLYAMNAVSLSKCLVCFVLFCGARKSKV